MRENNITFRRGDKVVTRQGKTGTVASIGSFGKGVYVRVEPYGDERRYEPSSLRKVS